MEKGRLSESLFRVVILISVLTCATALKHAQQTMSLQDLQYAKLNDQQRNLEDSINRMVEQMNGVEKNVSKTTNSSQKVILLETAILSERQKVFDLQSEITPAFQLSKTACLELTNQQKIDLMDNITAVKQQLAQLQQEIVLAPKCDKINAVEKDALKQMTLLESLESTILTECQSKSILTPTIYQTNIYADGWILGDQHIDDLVEEYYQRNIRYHNITNCPLHKPFFDGEECMLCQYPEPVFNILTRECTHCPEDQEPDSSTRTCKWHPHYTNFSSVENWATEGAPMPTPNRKLVPCPPEKPYFNGKTCQACVLPFFWSIKRNDCVKCPAQMVFDLNDKQCELPQDYKLTLLQGTRWVTNDCNVTRVVEDRVEILEINETKKYYSYCPKNKPYYDGIACINCPNEFNIDTRKCLKTPSSDKAYNDNMHCYMTKQYNFETDPLASSYTTNFPLKDTTTANCRKVRPYYDGIACVECQEPFPIFNVQTRKCSVCDPMDYYNNTEHKCLPRDIIYISTNEEHLMATQKVSIPDYEEEIHNKIVDNPDAVILPCGTYQYSNFKQCIDCEKEQYFNVELKECDVCDGTLNETSWQCNQRAYLYTNFSEQSIPRIVGLGNTTVEEENATIEEMLDIHKNARICPAQKPFSNMKKCLNCTKQSFNYTSMECVPIQCIDPNYPFYNEETDRCEQCPDGSVYSQVDQMCEKIVYVTNTNAIYFYIQEDNYTKLALEDEIFELEQNNAVLPCQASHPYFNGKECIDCAITRNVEEIEEHKPYFNLKSLECEGCQDFDNKTHRCSDPKNQTEVKCEYPTPFRNDRGQCEECPQDTVWIAAEQECSVCQNDTHYISDLQKCSNCKHGQIWNETTEECQDCPEGTFFDETSAQCVENCPEGQIWNTQSEECELCRGVYDQQAQTCEECLNGTYWIEEQMQCQECDEGMIYDQETYSCFSNQCQEDQIKNQTTGLCETWVSNVDAMGDEYIEEGEGTLENYKKQVEAKIEENQDVNVCPEQTPNFSAENECITCDEGQYFNLRTKLCNTCSSYNKDLKKCNTETPRFKPNVEDFYGTIFG